MNYYKQGDAARAEQIRAAFEKLGYTTAGFNFKSDKGVYYTDRFCKSVDFVSAPAIVELIKTHPDYQELELPVEPKFKAEDRIVSKSDKSTIYRIIYLHEEHREYIVEIEHQDYHESCPWIAFEDQDDYELAPKPHYDISNFHAGMPVLVRETNMNVWQYVPFSHCYTGGDGLTRFNAGLVGFTQCIPFNKDTEHLLGTTGPCDERFVNW